MAGSINKVILIGNLGADPEVRFSQDGKKIANMRLATTESWKDRATGERQSSRNRFDLTYNGMTTIGTVVKDQYVAVFKHGWLMLAI